MMSALDRYLDALSCLLLPAAAVIRDFYSVTLSNVLCYSYISFRNYLARALLYGI